MNADMPTPDSRVVVIDLDGEQREIEVEYYWNKGERRTHDYPGTEPHAEIVRVTDAETGEEMNADRIIALADEALRLEFEYEAEERERWYDGRSRCTTAF